MQLLKIYQVYYKPEQHAACEYAALLNKDCSLYFENSVILELVGQGAHRDAEYFGVVSWKLRKKVVSTLGPRVRISPFSPVALEGKLAAYRPDIIGLQEYTRHNPMKLFPGIHKDLAGLFGKVMSALGHDWKSKYLEHNFYCNHFVAKSEIYERYVLEMLNPAMTVMNNMPELMIDSGYPKSLPIELRMKWGIEYYPYHPFICERLFSYWVSLNKFDVKYY